MSRVKNQMSLIRTALPGRLSGKNQFYSGLAHASVALGLAFVSATGALGQGTLAPSGPPGPTMKTLSQVEPRAPISSLPFAITNPGSYYLTTNLTGAASANGITVQASDVTIDLHGFTLAGVSGSLNGVAVSSAQNGLAIFGGVVQGWGGSGISAASASGGQFSQLTLQQNSGAGLVAGTNSLVRDCVAIGNAGDGMDLTSFCLVENNNCQADNSCGIHVLGNGCRVEGNHFGFNGSTGLQVDGTQNLIVRNSAVNNTATNYNIAANNDYGQIYSSPGAGFTNSNPWANFSSTPITINMCADGIKDGNETDVDCGGGTCPSCALGKGCNAGSDCQSGYCSGGVCATPPGGNGMACASGSQCLSGNCVTGICCNTACNGGPCVSCAGGTCGNVQAGTVCSSSSCNGGTLTQASICNGNGTCVPGTPVSCAPYICSGNACVTSCSGNSPSGDAQCASPDYCSGSTCGPKLSSGSTCSRNGQCISGTCSSGQCM